MIKQINHQNFLITPFVAIKAWEIFNIENGDVVLVEDETTETPVALDYTDYGEENPILNRQCDIALEQQSEDIAIFQEGMTGSGRFDPTTDATNTDGTYKRLVYDQIRDAFYNNYNNPTEIFGMEYIDFPLGQTIRNISDKIRVFTIPQTIFGDKVSEGSVNLYDTSLDDNITVSDDGYQNLVAGTNVFSKIQEVRPLGNTLLSGSPIIICPTAVGPVLSASVGIDIQIVLSWTYPANNQTGFQLEKSLDSGSTWPDVFLLPSSSLEYLDNDIALDTLYWYQVAAITSGGVGNFSNMVSESVSDIVPAPPANDSASVSKLSFFAGAIASTPPFTDTSSYVVFSFESGTLFNSIITQSSATIDSSSMNIDFYTGSIFVQAVTQSVPTDSGSLIVAFYTGSLFNSLVTQSAQPDTGSINVAFYTGSIVLISILAPPISESNGITVGFYTGSLS